MTGGVTQRPQDGWLLLCSGGCARFQECRYLAARHRCVPIESSQTDTACHLAGRCFVSPLQVFFYRMYTGFLLIMFSCSNWLSASCQKLTSRGNANPYALCYGRKLFAAGGGGRATYICARGRSTYLELSCLKKVFGARGAGRATYICARGRFRDQACFESFATNGSRACTTSGDALGVSAPRPE